MSTNDHSPLAMQSLADLAMRDGQLRPSILRHIEELCAIGTPAMRAWGKRLLSELRKLPN